MSKTPRRKFIKATIGIAAAIGIGAGSIAELINIHKPPTQAITITPVSGALYPLYPGLDSKISSIGEILKGRAILRGDIVTLDTAGKVKRANKKDSPIGIALCDSTESHVMVYLGSGLIRCCV